MSKRRFLIGREKPGVESEVARLISETLEQEKSPQNQVQKDDDAADQETENGQEAEETQPEEQTSHIVHDHDHGKQEDQLLAGERNKSAMEEVCEKRD